MTTERKRLYWVWADMRSRCQNPNHAGYKNYGGRGIKVCARWVSFENFSADMGPRPPSATIDRIDNDGNYEPGNCRWATRAQQNSNRRNCIFVEDAGDRVTLKEYCRRRGLVYRAIAKRIRSRNWPVDLALSAPAGYRRKAAA